MKKLSRDVEDSEVNLTENGCSTRIISKKLKIRQSAVIRGQKRSNAVQRSGPRRILPDADARLMMQKIKNEKNCKFKGASAAIGKLVSQWTAQESACQISIAQFL